MCKALILYYNIYNDKNDFQQMLKLYTSHCHKLQNKTHLPNLKIRMIYLH